MMISRRSTSFGCQRAGLVKMGRVALDGKAMSYKRMNKDEAELEKEAAEGRATELREQAQRQPAKMDDGLPDAQPAETVPTPDKRESSFGCSDSLKRTYRGGHTIWPPLRPTRSSAGGAPLRVASLDRRLALWWGQPLQHELSSLAVDFAGPLVVRAMQTRG